MSIVAQVLATITYFFYPAAYIVSIMGLGGPNATNDIKNFKAIRLFLAYPIVISALFLLFDSTYLGINGFYLIIISIAIWLVSMNTLGVNRSIKNLKKGILNSGYSVVQGVAYYNAQAIDNADAGSFYIYPDDAPSSVQPYFGLAKDNNYLYHQGKVVHQVDPNTVEFIADKNGKISSEFIKDSQHVYYHFNILEGADPKTFAVVSGRFFDAQADLSKDKNNFWYNDQIIDGICPETARYITEDNVHSLYLQAQAKENKAFHYYWQGKLIHISQGSAAKPLSPNIVVIDNQVFINGVKLLSNSEVQFVSSLNGDSFLKTANQVFFINEIELKLEQITGADPATFEILGHRYTKDKTNVYYENNQQFVPINNADPASFELVLDSAQYDAQDKSHRYLHGKRVQQQGL